MINEQFILYGLFRKLYIAGLPWVWESPYPWEWESDFSLWGSPWEYPYGDLHGNTHMGIPMAIPIWGSPLGKSDFF